MPPLRVHLSPAFVVAGSLEGSVVVVADILRATTTLLHALASGAVAVYPCASIGDARSLAKSHSPAILAGEREGVPIPGFDLGNSPLEMTRHRCAGKNVVMTTTNGTRALAHAHGAGCVLVGAFVNLRATCELLHAETRPVDILCAGEHGAIALEDALFAGAVVEALLLVNRWTPDDAARLARLAFRHETRPLAEALADTAGGFRLRSLGYDEDIAIAATIDAFDFAAELRPEAGCVQIVQL